MANETEHKRRYNKIKTGTRLIKYRNNIDDIDNDDESITNKHVSELTKRKPIKILKMHISDVAHKARALEHRKIGYTVGGDFNKKGKSR